MKPHYKFLRTVIAASISAALWAGCTINGPMQASDRGSGGDKAIVLDNQEDLTHPHIDTHPEWRLGVNMAFPDPQKAYASIADLSTVGDQRAF